MVDKQLSIVFLITVLLGLSFSVYGQEDITGVWEVLDNETGEPKAHVKIFKRNETLVGRVVKYLPKADLFVCASCPDSVEGKPLKDVDLLWGLQAKKDQWTGGFIMDPRRGGVYRLSARLSDQKLRLRGYIGIPLFGQTIWWNRVEKE